MNDLSTESAPAGVTGIAVVGQLLHRIGRWLPTPYFVDPAQRLRATLLRRFLLVFVVLGVSCIFIASQFTGRTVVLILSGSTLLHVACLVLVGLRHIRFAGLLVLLNVSSCIFALVIRAEGLYDLAMYMLPILLISASLILQRGDYWLYTGTMLAGICIVGYLHYSGWYGGNSIVTAHARNLSMDLAVYLVLTTTTAVLSRLCTNMLFRDVVLLDNSRQALESINQDLDQRVRARTQDLETANRELSTFTHAISHDLRTPLRAICGFSRILLDDHAAALGAEGRGLLQRIDAAGARLDKLNDSLLRFIRLSSQWLNREEIDLGELAGGLRAELDAAYPDRDIEWRIAVLPTLNADRNLLTLLLRHLLDNAIKFSGSMSPATVELGCTLESGEQVLFVRDNGVGFNADYSDKLFEVFQRLHAPSEFTGDGLGLAFAQRIVHRHGGRIWAESSPGDGATFYFTLPDPARPPTD